MLDEAVMKELGARLMSIRLAQNLSQRQVAEQAGLGLRTVQRLEQGEAATQLSGFIRVCRVLGLLERVDELIPEPQPSPLELLRFKERRRRRSSKPSKPRASTGDWTWGESS